MYKFSFLQNNDNSNNKQHRHRSRRGRHYKSKKQNKYEEKKYHNATESDTLFSGGDEQSEQFEHNENNSGKIYVIMITMF